MVVAERFQMLSSINNGEIKIPDINAISYKIFPLANPLMMPLIPAIFPLTNIKTDTANPINRPPNKAFSGVKLLWLI